VGAAAVLFCFLLDWKALKLSFPYTFAFIYTVSQAASYIEDMYVDYFLAEKTAAQVRDSSRSTL
jgi:hypothetical protein